MNRIPMENLKDGYLYEIDARNQSRGIWVEEKKGFEIARKKFDKIFLFVEFDYDTGAPFGTATPYVEVEKVPEEILADEAKRLEYLMRFDYPTSRQKYRYENDIGVMYRKFTDLNGFEFTKDNWR